MPSLIEMDPGFGFAAFNFDGAKTKPLDLIVAYDHYLALREKHTVFGKSDSDTVAVIDWDKIWADWRAYLAAFEFPADLSIAAMPKTVSLILETIEGIRKKDQAPGS